MGPRSRAVAVALVSSGLTIVVTLAISREVLRRQAAHARRLIGKPLGEAAPDADRVWRSAEKGKPVDLLMVGDSIAAGLGAHRRKDVLGARIAKGVGRALARPVRLRTVAVVGSESSALGAQLDALPPDYHPHVAVVIVGGNDVTHRIPPSTSVGHLEDAIARLQDRGAIVVVGTCPDLGAIRPVPQPLRALGSRLSRQLAQAQAQAAESAGAHVVSLRRAVGPIFLSQPDEMFSLDRFHPSALGYRRTADAFVPVLVAALAGHRRRRAKRAAADLDASSVKRRG